MWAEAARCEERYREEKRRLGTELCTIHLGCTHLSWICEKREGAMASVETWTDEVISDAAADDAALRYEALADVR